MFSNSENQTISAKQTNAEFTLSLFLFFNSQRAMLPLFHITTI